MQNCTYINAKDANACGNGDCHNVCREINCNVLCYATCTSWCKGNSYSGCNGLATSYFLYFIQTFFFCFILNI